MSIADQIREHVVTHYIAPARQKGESTVSVRAGDVHSEMGFKNRLPNVCSALGSDKFETFASVKRVSLEGPSQGSNAVYTFRL
jgi:5-methylcytosine-specific restriction protein B